MTSPSGPSSLNAAAWHGGSRPAAPRADSPPQRVNAAPPLAGTYAAPPAIGSLVPLPRLVGDRPTRQTIAAEDPRSRERGTARRWEPPAGEEEGTVAVRAAEDPGLAGCAAQARGPAQAWQLPFP